MLSFTFIKCINYGLDFEITFIYICTIVGCFWLQPKQRVFKI